ncbi:sugar porter family MFS transporter [Isoptericola sp. b441]|uniref:Sugar porter family MFS transporter n=1 Tax=Actinotalea lenta TaxID=3064654 RepID=A0ABT9DA90_9CELL|nr:MULTISPECIES: sugar porter family MFS transporter [unclassified Isoptericola]MDO8107824.1 sugar porter family MFS transporter [Isoptericola sp. b441]MDO8120505.1 sugar porter family MFS transporter [Isoptericola sp. b490]
MSSFTSEAFSGKNRFLLRIALIAAVGGFLFGYDTGIISGAQLYITKSLTVSDSQKQWIVGSLLVGAVIGAWVSSYLAERIGRKWTKVWSGTTYVVGGVVSAFAPNIAVLLGARFVLGLAVGTASFVSVEYISEQVPARIRGGVTSFNQLMVTSGILVAYLVAAAFQNVSGTWRWMLGLSVVPGLVLALGMLTVPRSPRWLIAHGHEDEAREVLSRSRSEQEVEDEVQQMQEAAGRSRDIRLRSLFTGRLRPLMLVGLALAVFQQLIGVNTVVYYSATILNDTGLSISGSVLRAVTVGITNVAFTILAIALLDKVGRRALLLVGTVGATISLVGLGLWFQLSSWQSATWLALVFLLTFMASFAVGLGPVFWLMISEIYPLGVRSRAMSVATIANWAANFVISFYFLALVKSIGEPATFWLYAGFGVIATAFFLAKVPETKDKTLEQIEAELGADSR